jgi:hypothetical protein
MFKKTKPIPVDTYKPTDNYEPKGALAFSRDQAPPAFVAVMLELQDRLADAITLTSTMATAKESGYLAHAAGQLCALQELWEALEQRRAESVTVE